MINRRAFTAGALAGLATSASTFAADKPQSPVAHGILTDNSIAKAFEPYTQALPDVGIVGPSGTRLITAFKGRTVLMPLWAEWCAPCLSELPDFARLQQKYGNDKFAIIPILTGTEKKFTPQTLAGIFEMIHAQVFEPLIENGRGKELMLTMAHQPGGAMLPCNLLIKPDGQVIARELGQLSDTDDTSPAATRSEVLARTQKGDVQSRWGQADGEQFAQAMANGFLS